jgi:hypothetical protein
MDLKAASIYSTEDYKIFRLLSSNRSVTESHVADLAAKMEVKNLLHLNPIIVNNNYDVIDGQHRLKAAEKLGVLVWYVKDDSVDHTDIAMLNSGNKNWAGVDYLKYYAKNGYPEYVKMLAFFEKNSHISVNILRRMGNRGTGYNDEFKEGRFKFNEEEVQQFADYLNDIVNETGIEYLRSNYRFHLALRVVTTNKDYDHSRMMKKLERHFSSLRGCSSTESFLEMFEYIYNSSVHSQNRVFFRKKGKIRNYTY